MDRESNPELVLNLNSCSLHALAVNELLSVAALPALEFFSIPEIRKKSSKQMRHGCLIFH